MSRPVRILHVVGSMNRGGVETWLMHVLRHIDRERFQMDFLVHTDEPAAYDDEIRALGSRIIPCLAPNRPWQYARTLRRILRDEGSYDVVHSHVHHFSGLVLAVARTAGVPVRIAHSHNDTSREQAAARLQRRAYYRAMRRLIVATSTLRLAASREAERALFGERRAGDERQQVLYYGIDLAPFTQEVDGEALRARLGIPPGRRVIGHVGRFALQKNHAFLIRVFNEVVARDPNTHLVLVGEGPLREATERLVAELDIAGHVTFAGARDDVPALMLGAFDLFLLPSLHEGLPVVMLEAQAAGLPCVISDVVSPETDVVPGLVTRMSLADSSEEWAARIACTTEQADASLSLAQVRHADRDVQATTKYLTRLYRYPTRVGNQLTRGLDV